MCKGEMIKAHCTFFLPMRSSAVENFGTSHLLPHGFTQLNTASIRTDRISSSHSHAFDLPTRCLLMGPCYECPPSILSIFAQVRRCALICILTSSS